MDDVTTAMARLEGALRDARGEPVARYECWGCGETFTFRALADIDMDGEPCPNRCGNVLSPAE